MKNTGKPSERDFEQRLRTYGKNVYFLRLVDAAEIVGRVGAKGFARSQPSDYVVVTSAYTYFAEVKSTVDEKRFHFSLLKKSQNGGADQVLAAGGQYWVIIHRLQTDQWYWIPYEEIRGQQSKGVSSFTWEQLKDHEWKLPSQT